MEIDVSCCIVCAMLDEAILIWNSFFFFLKGEPIVLDYRQTSLQKIILNSLQNTVKLLRRKVIIHLWMMSVKSWSDNASTLIHAYSWTHIYLFCCFHCCHLFSAGFEDNATYTVLIFIVQSLFALLSCPVLLYGQRLPVSLAQHWELLGKWIRILFLDFLIKSRVLHSLKMFSSWRLL